jgi:hypothetical protein
MKPTIAPDDRTTTAAAEDAAGSRDHQAKVEAETQRLARVREGRLSVGRDVTRHQVALAKLH